MGCSPSKELVQMQTMNGGVVGRRRIRRSRGTWNDVLANGLSVQVDDHDKTSEAHYIAAIFSANYGGGGGGVRRSLSFEFNNSGKKAATAFGTDFNPAGQIAREKAESQKKEQQHGKDNDDDCEAAGGGFMECETINAWELMEGLDEGGGGGEEAEEAAAACNCNCNCRHHDDDDDTETCLVIQRPLSFKYVFSDYNTPHNNNKNHGGDACLAMEEEEEEDSHINTSFKDWLPPDDGHSSTRFAADDDDDNNEFEFSSRSISSTSIPAQHILHHHLHRMMMIMNSTNPAADLEQQQQQQQRRRRPDDQKIRRRPSGHCYNAVCSFKSDYIGDDIDDVPTSDPKLAVGGHENTEDEEELATKIFDPELVASLERAMAELSEEEWNALRSVEFE